MQKTCHDSERGCQNAVPATGVLRGRVPRLSGLVATARIETAPTSAPIVSAAANGEQANGAQNAS
jgi:hypothetical protein